MIFFDIIIFKNFKTDYKVIKISFFLFLLVLAISLLNYVPDYPGGWSFLRQFFLLSVGFFSLCRMLSASKLTEVEIENVFIKSVFLLSVLNLLGIGAGSIDGRVTLFGMNPNLIGIFAVIAILFLLKRSYFENDKTKLNRKKHNILFFISILFMLFSTGSRGGVISLFLIITAFFYFREKKIVNKIKYLVLSLLASFSLYLLVINNALLNRRFFGNEEDSDAGRSVLWEKVLSIVDTNPIFGVGIFKYQQQIELLNNNRIINTHNEFLSFLVYTGFVGLFFFLYFLFKLFMRSIKKYKVDNEPLLIIILIILIFNLFKAGGLLLSPLVWALFSYILVYSKFDDEISLRMSLNRRYLKK